MKLKVALTVVGLSCLLTWGRTANAQVITTYYPPTVTYYAPAVTYAAPTIVMRPVVEVPNCSATIPFTTYYTPATTTYYAPAIAPAVVAPVVPVTTFYRSPVWGYDPSRILPRRRWQLVYP